MEDWSSRRNSAMNRARELRSKITELRDERSSESGIVDAASIVSSARELQRQKRSRQLAETQRLLEQFADVEVADVASSVETSTQIPNDSRFETRIPLGRGRGRGRSGSGGGGSAMTALASSSSRHVGSLLQSDNLNMNKPFLRDTAELPCDRRSKKDDNIRPQQCYYLRDHRVPEEKEGECDKLVVLRQRLAARRRVRERELVGVGRDEEQPITSIELPMQGLGISTQQRVKKNDIVSHPSLPVEDYSTQQGMFEHKDDESSRSYRSSFNNNNATARQMNVSNTESGSDSIVSEKSVVDIELIQCDTCGRSFAPKIYEKHFDADGNPKCSKQTRRRPKFDSAKNRIANNSNLNSDEQMQALKMNKKVVKELKKKKSGASRSRRSSKWREESRAFREAMKASRYC
jgi:hypothetical protein